MKDDFDKILQKYNKGTASPQEIKLIEDWYLSIDKNAELVDLEDIFLTSKNELQKQYISKKHFSIRNTATIITAACALLIATLFFVLPNSKKEEIAITVAPIVPGGDKALLTLEGGQELDLQDMVLGQSITQEGIEVSKVEEGKIVIKKLNSAVGRRAEHVIRTPKGGEFELTLPDGTIIKLNAESEVYFYSDYNIGSREVKLNGEAYFDVQKSTIPFLVKSDKQEISVLGTIFNVKAYLNESQTTTKLISGSVLVTNNKSKDQIIMQPGDEIINTGAEMKKIETEITERVDWVNDEIVFNQKNIGLIMNDISRWYDIDVVFENDTLRDLTYTGTIPRYTDFSNVLDVLEKTGSLKFEIKNRTVIVK